MRIRNDWGSKYYSVRVASATLSERCSALTLYSPRSDLPLSADTGATSAARRTEKGAKKLQVKDTARARSTAVSTKKCTRSHHRTESPPFHVCAFLRRSDYGAGSGDSFGSQFVICPTRSHLAPTPPTRRVPGVPQSVTMAPPADAAKTCDHMVTTALLHQREHGGVLIFTSGNHDGFSSPPTKFVCKARLDWSSAHFSRGDYRSNYQRRRPASPGGGGAEHFGRGSMLLGAGRRPLLPKGLCRRFLPLGGR